MLKGVRLTALITAALAFAACSQGSKSGSSLANSSSQTVSSGGSAAPGPAGTTTANASGTSTPNSIAFADFDTALDAMFAGLPQGAAQLNILCTRDAGSLDAINANFCPQEGIATPPVLTGLADLINTVHSSLIVTAATTAPVGTAASSGTTMVTPTIPAAKDGNMQGRGNGGQDHNNGSVRNSNSSGTNNLPFGTDPLITFSAGSTSLVARFTSAVNPRMFIFQPPIGQASSNFTILTFVRGEQVVEIATNDSTQPAGQGLNFYLIHFQQACNSAPGGCTTEDLFGPGIEKNWVSYSVYEDDDLGDTFIDCHRCHEPGGPNAPKILRMQENAAPFTHFLSSSTDGGKALLADFLTAHPASEVYAQVPVPEVANSNPAALAQLLTDNGFGTQPNPYNTALIETQVEASAAGQPIVNIPPGSSASWLSSFAMALTGQFISVPYHDAKVSDPQILAAYATAYQAFLSTGSGTIPDPRTVLLASARADMNFVAQPGATGPQLLAQACAICHNSNLDQTISRAHFNVDMSSVGSNERALAVQRLNLPISDPKHMPPATAMVLTPDEITTLSATITAGAPNASSIPPTATAGSAGT